jgi:hypothetical protein
LEIDDRFVGQTIQCPDCGRALTATATEAGSRRTSGLALASLVLALVGAFTVVGTVAAIALGVVALRSIARHKDRLAGRNLARAGIVLGTILTAVSVAFYVKGDLFGLDGLLRQPEWAGRLDYSGPLELSSEFGFSLKRPTAQWGLYRPREERPGPAGAAPARRDEIALVNVHEGAYIIAFGFSKGPLADDKDTSRDDALNRFLKTELIRRLRRKRTGELPPHQVQSNKVLPAEGGRETEEVIVDVRLGRQERTFLLRIIRRGDGLGGDLYVVAIGTQKSRFPALEKKLRESIETFKLER